VQSPLRHVPTALQGTTHQDGREVDVDEGGAAIDSGRRGERCAVDLDGANGRGIDTKLRKLLDSQGHRNGGIRFQLLCQKSDGGEVPAAQEEDMCQYVQVPGVHQS
jgi:hypothetical protein